VEEKNRTRCIVTDWVVEGSLACEPRVFAASQSDVQAGLQGTRAVEPVTFRAKPHCAIEPE